jgi:predicted transcriptional regulator
MRIEQSVIWSVGTMAGRKTLAITDRQFEALRLLWDKGSLTVRELMEHLPRGNRQPYTTVLGLLQNMEKAGLVSHREEGLTYRYEAAVSRHEATGVLLHDFLGRFFRGSAEALVLGLVDSQALSPQELRDIEARLSRAAASKRSAEKNSRAEKDGSSVGRKRREP